MAGPDTAVGVFDVLQCRQESECQGGLRSLDFPSRSRIFAGAPKDSQMITSNTIRYDFTHSTLGAVVVARSQKGVCAIALGDNRRELLRDLQRRFPHAELVED